MWDLDRRLDLRLLKFWKIILTKYIRRTGLWRTTGFLRLACFAGGIEDACGLAQGPEGRMLVVRLTDLKKPCVPSNVKIKFTKPT